MAIKISFVNKKGGVAKTTTAINVAAGLKKAGFRVLFIDLDPQRNSTEIYRAKIEDEYTLFDVFKDKCELKNTIQHMPLGDIVPGDPALDNIINEIVNSGAWASYIKYGLDDLEDEYDYVIMDTHPDASVYVINALAASDGCIIPVNADKFSIDGLSDEIMLISKTQDKKINPKLKIFGIVLTKFDKRNSLDKQMLENLPTVAGQLNIPVFKTCIRVCQKCKSMQTSSLPVFEEFPKETASEDYLNLVKEIIKETK